MRHAVVLYGSPGSDVAADGEADRRHAHSLKVTRAIYVPDWERAHDNLQLRPKIKRNSKKQSPAQLVHFKPTQKLIFESPGVHGLNTIGIGEYRLGKLSTKDDSRSGHVILAMLNVPDDFIRSGQESPLGSRIKNCCANDYPVATRPTIRCDIGKRIAIQNGIPINKDQHIRLRRRASTTAPDCIKHVLPRITADVRYTSRTTIMLHLSRAVTDDYVNWIDSGLFKTIYGIVKQRLTPVLNKHLRAVDS